MRKKPHKKIGEINCVDKILQNETKIDEVCSSFGQIQNTFVSIDEKVIKGSVFFLATKLFFFAEKVSPHSWIGSRTNLFFFGSPNNTLCLYFIFRKNPLFPITVRKLSQTYLSTVHFISANFVWDRQCLIPCAEIRSLLGPAGCNFNDCCPVTTWVLSSLIDA